MTLPGDAKTQEFTRSLGVALPGGSDELLPQPLDAAIIFAPLGEPVPHARTAAGRCGPRFLEESVLSSGRFVTLRRGLVGSQKIRLMHRSMAKETDGARL